MQILQLTKYLENKVKEFSFYTVLLQHKIEYILYMFFLQHIQMINLTEEHYII